MNTYGVKVYRPPSSALVKHMLGLPLPASPAVGYVNIWNAIWDAHDKPIKQRALAQMFVRRWAIAHGKQIPPSDQSGPYWCVKVED